MPKPKNSKSVSSRKQPTRSAKVSKRSTKSTTADVAASGTKRINKNSKLQGMLDLLKRPHGATISDLIAATGWQPHSVRGAISGRLKKKLGHQVISEVVGDTRSYRIAS